MWRTYKASSGSVGCDWFRVVGCLSPAVSYQVELDFTCCASFNAQC